MIQTVIFDMDGVIIDSEPVYFRIDKQMFEELNIAVSLKNIARTSEPHLKICGMRSLRNIAYQIIPESL